MSNFIHNSSFVEENVNIGEGTNIWYFCHISKNVNIGKNCNIGQNVFIDKNVNIGNNVKIQNNVSVYYGVNIDNDVFLGPSCVFTNVINPRSTIERKSEVRQTHVNRGATIGANSTIVCGITIGEYALVGAGSVVTKNVDQYTLVFGNPAKTKGYICSCGNKLVKVSTNKFQCNTCLAKYKMNNKKIVKVESD